eukprot:1189257-Prorocentrum_minimum.AAC.5
MYRRSHTAPIIIIHATCPCGPPAPRWSSAAPPSRSYGRRPHPVGPPKGAVGVLHDPQLVGHLLQGRGPLAPVQVRVVVHGDARVGEVRGLPVLRVVAALEGAPEE